MTTEIPILDESTVLLVGTSDCIDAVHTQLQTESTATIHTASTAAEAIERRQKDTIDCVITEYDLNETTGVELIEDIRAETSTLPVVLCTTAGSESVASDAIRAGVTDYLAPQIPIETSDTELLTRVERAVRNAQRTTTTRERARQFDAIFDDSHTATWVLDPEGTLDRVNQTARRMIDSDTEAVVGRQFWRLPWWRGDSLQRDIKQLVGRAQRGSFGNAVISQPTETPDPRVLDLSVRPVENERGDLVSIVVEAVDVTDRVDLERNLRKSEELHRVTLNNMTDTVLITDEDGDYTYVCPNVHFIFGYTAADIREMGGIEELLGPDLFDRDELAEEGVLKNIECVATDKAGREHTLLVNVREVSIQDGTLLYSCRDITKRKQREEALATLQETARDFLYAETHDEIAHQIVTDTANVLDLDASAVYIFDDESNHLEPAACSQRMRDLHGPLPSVHADRNTLPGSSFVDNESLIFDEVHDASRLDNPATDLRGTAYIPLGSHGVFVAGAATPGAFDEVTRELADLLAATAEAALDRVTRESRLREQDRALQTKNDRLTELNQINETIREIDQAVVQATTKEEIRHTVCELLTRDDRFQFAWVGTPSPSMDTVTPEAWAGAEQGYLDSQAFEIGPSRVEPSGQALATGDVAMVENVAEDLHGPSWRSDALARDYLSVLSIPLVYNDLSHGVLTVYADTRNAFSERTQAVLGELAETIAAAMSSIERKNALLTTSVTRVEFTLDDPTFVLSRLARAADCTVTYQGGVQQTSDGNYVFVTANTTAVESVEAAAADLVAIQDVQPISVNGGESIFRLQLAAPFLAIELADHGAVFRTATATPAETSLVIDIPESVAVRDIASLLGDSFGGVDLQSKRTLDQMAEEDRFEHFFDDVTDRQLEVVQTAYFSGYFESPREQSGEDVADTLGISPPAFYEHTRTVQRKLFTALFEDGDTSMATMDG
jgi:PAS domain S-box-containing protein